MSVETSSTRETLPERSGSVWDYVSASRLNLWLKCPLAFKLRYIDGLRTPPAPAMFLGKCVHAGLEFHYRHRQFGISPEVETVIARIRSDWPRAVEEEGINFASTAEESQLQTAAVRLVQAYLLHVDGLNEVPEAVETAVETPLVDPATGENLGIPLVGVIDLVLGDKDGPTIVDFKTTSRSAAPLEVSHEIQLGCYGYLFRETSGQQEAGLEIRNLVKTKTPQIDFHSWPARDERHFRRLFAVIRAYLDDLDRGRFVFRPGLGCSMCDYCGDRCLRWNG